MATARGGHRKSGEEATRGGGEEEAAEAAVVGRSSSSSTTRRGASEEDNFRSFLTCNICLELFTRPKILPCIHSFCLQCLRAYLTTAGGSSSTAANWRKKGGFPCPTCRQLVPIAKASKTPEITWPDQLKDNFVLTSMLEAWNQQQSSSLSSSSSTTPLTDSGTGCSAAKESSPCYCCCSSTVMVETGSDTTSITCRAAAVAVCWNCAALVCADCAASAHSGCSQVQTISVAGPERRQQMLDWLPHVNDHLAHLQQRHASTNSNILALQARRHATLNQVAQAAKDAVHAVHQQEQRLRQTVDKEMETALTRLQHRQTQCSASMGDLRSLRQALEQCVLEKDVELLQQAELLKQRYDAEMSGRDHEEGEDEDLNTGTFLPALLTDLKSTVLVGVFHHGTDQSPSSSPVTSVPSSPVTSAPSSPVTSDNASWCRLTEGPVIRHSPRRRTLPPAFLFSPPSPLLQLELPVDSGTRAEGQGVSPQCSLSSPLLLSGQRGVTCHHASAFSTRVKGDKAEPLIRDMTVLSNGWLVATDTANRCVKCYYKAQPDDAKYRNKRLPLSQPPYGVCCVEGQMVAVTVPKERLLQLVMARPHLVPVSSLPLPLPQQQQEQREEKGEPAWAVVSLGQQRLAVTTCPQGRRGSVLILQVNGESVQCLARFSSLVTTPLYITATPDLHHLVTSDPTSCHVACLASDTGNAVFQFHARGKVMGVTCYSKLILLVDQAPAISLLTNEGRCLHTLTLPKGKTGCSKPRAVAVATDSSFYVSNDEDGKIHLFSLRWLDPPAAGT